MEDVFSIVIVWEQRGDPSNNIDDDKYHTYEIIVYTTKGEYPIDPKKDESSWDKKALWTEKLFEGATCMLWWYYIVDKKHEK